jgi:ribosomal protein L7/L12
MANGGRSPDTAARCWYFEIHRAHHTLDRWKELVPRIMFDINTTLRRREPSDAAWIDVESFAVSPLQPRLVLTMHESNPRSLGWVNFDRARVWEPAVCYFVDDSGNYDMMSAHDFSELLLYRLLGRGEMTPDEFKSFLDRYYAESEPAAGQKIYANAEARFKNLTSIRPANGAPKKTPNQPPFTCCPDVNASWGGGVPGVPGDVRIAGEPEAGVAGAEATGGALASVYLEAIGESLIQVMVTVRDFTGLGLVEATSLTKSAPAIVLSNVPRDEAERCLRELQRVGATASLR